MPKRKPSSLERIDLYSAGIDIGSKSHFVAVDRTLDKKPVREYLAFTSDLKDMADWLLSLGVKRIAMESTGIYWIPVYQVLVSKGLEVKLVNARHLKNVPRQKDRRPGLPVDPKTPQLRTPCRRFFARSNHI